MGVICPEPQGKNYEIQNYFYPRPGLSFGPGAFDSAASFSPGSKPAEIRSLAPIPPLIRLGAVEQ